MPKNDPGHVETKFPSEIRRRGVPELMRMPVSDAGLFASPSDGVPVTPNVIAVTRGTLRAS